MKQKIITKTIKTLVKACSHCNEIIFGNGSVILPYQCKCGEWEWDSEEKDYKLKEN